MVYNNDKVNHDYRPDDSSIVVTFSEKYDFMADAAEANQLAVSLLNSIDTRNYLIVDFRNTAFAEGLSISLDELIITSSSLNAAVWHHTKVRQVIFVSDNDVLRRIAHGLNSEDYGNLNIQIFDDMDEALAYVHSQKLGAHITYQRRTTSRKLI